MRRITDCPPSRPWSRCTLPHIGHRLKPLWQLSVRRHPTTELRDAFFTCTNLLTVFIICLTKASNPIHVYDSTRRLFNESAKINAIAVLMADLLGMDDVSEEHHRGGDRGDQSDTRSRTLER